MTTPDEQNGVLTTTLKKAESDLTQQNSATAVLDLLVISAILNAHAATGAGAEKLRRLQREIESAVQNRTDLNTAAGARDFQRFLIGKLREIAAVVEDVDLDDRSKAALAVAWAALYESSKEPQPEPGPPDPMLSDPLLTEPMLTDPYLGLEPGLPPATAPAAPGIPPVTLTPPAAPSLPTTAPAGAGLPSSPLLPSIPRFDDLGAAQNPPPLPDDALLDELLAAEEAALADLDAEPDDAEPEFDPEHEDTEEETPESKTVALPDGDTVTASTPELAAALRAVLAGTPITEAFHTAGITIPPPGTAVTDPVDPGRVGTGDIAMFADRQAVALDESRVWIDGEIRPLTAVSGPGFLGWLRPSESTGTSPNGAPAPAPTRPAAAVAPAR